LTGEAVPVRKALAAGLPSDTRPGGDDLPFVYSGSLIVRGQGLAEVTATGARSEIGKIGKSLSGIESEPPPIQNETRRLVRVFAIGGVAISVLFTVLYGWLQSAWLNAFLGGIALSMSLLPEEFPVILTVFMVMGAWRISRAGVLTRRSAAIETLGAATVLCTDKTGTLTENRMTIADVRPADAVLHTASAVSGGAEADQVIAFGRLASQVEPFDPMELAFHLRAEELALEAAVLQRLDVIQFAAGDVKRALGIHDHAHAAAFHEDVAAGRAVLQIHFVLQAGAAAADHRHAQHATGPALLGEQCGNLLRGAGRQFDQTFIASAEIRRGRWFAGKVGNHF